MKLIRIEFYAGVEIIHSHSGYSAEIKGKYFFSSRKDKVLDFINQNIEHE